MSKLREIQECFCVRHVTEEEAAWLIKELNKAQPVLDAAKQHYQFHSDPERHMENTSNCSICQAVREWRSNHED